MMKKIKKLLYILWKSFVFCLILLMIGAVILINQFYFNGPFHFIKDKKTDILLPVLLYHDIAETVPASDPYHYAYVNTPECLEENLMFLLERGYCPISFEQLYDAVEHGEPLPAKPVLITFDDGYIGQYDLAYPVLKKLNVKAAVFVVTDWVGTNTGDVKYFSWQQALEMKNSGLVEIFSHNSRHLFLDRYPVEEVRAQAADSFKIIDEQLGANPLRAFAYPYGASSSELVSAIKGDGVQIQMNDIGVNHITSIDLSDIKRIGISCSMTGQEILELINGCG